MQILHIIGLALLEEKRQREKGSSKVFNFIGPASEQSGKKNFLAFTFQDIKRLLTEREVCMKKYQTEVLTVRTECSKVCSKKTRFDIFKV